MIRQEVNLYHERFKEQKILLSAAHALILMGLLLLLLLVASYFYVDMKATEQQLHQQNLIAKTQATERLERLQARLKELLADKTIDQAMARVSRDIQIRKRMIDFVDQNRFGSGEGFSENLGSLAQLQQEDLWLNEISLSGDYIRLGGSALNAESVPQYFNLFRHHDLFAGRVFDVFELDRDQGESWKVDFVIASREISND